MTKDYESDFEQQEFEETAERVPNKKPAPWNAKYSEDENLKNRQYSRTARNQPVREATTLSKVLLAAIGCALLVPFVLFWWISSNNNSNDLPARTASQVVISRNTESSSSVASESSSVSSATSESVVSGTNGPAATTNRPTVPASSSSVTPTTPPPAPEPVQPTTPEPPQTGGTSYTIQAGDSWYGIAQRHGVDMYELLAANGATIDSLILPGQTIIIP